MELDKLTTNKPEIKLVGRMWSSRRDSGKVERKKKTITISREVELPEI